MAVLITGFNAFADVAVNPSAVVVEAIRSLPSFRSRVYGEVLPTEYAAAEARIEELLVTMPLTACLSLGAGGGAAIRIERTAYNVDDASVPDNRGELRRGSPIDPAAPSILGATLPFAAMYDAIARRGIAVTFSDDPGRYVCNHVFFHALNVIRKRSLPIAYGFMHVPMYAETPGDDPMSMPLPMIVAAVAECIPLLDS